jgi:hypothetical protein
MDISNINALTRSGSYPASRAAVTSGPQRAVSSATRAAAMVVSDQQLPAEPVLQGELLQKRRHSSSSDTANLLDSMRAMDRLLRDTAATDTAPPRDARRAIATYTQQMVIPNTNTGAAAARIIDYFV